MMRNLTHATIWVHDQDEALDFYTKKLGMEVREDVSPLQEMGNYRWLTVGPTSQPDVSFILTVPESTCDRRRTGRTTCGVTLSPRA